jgi:hypothetical protein
MAVPDVGLRIEVRHDVTPAEWKPSNLSPGRVAHVIAKLIERSPCASIIASCTKLEVLTCVPGDVTGGVLAREQKKLRDIADAAWNEFLP